MRNNQNKRFQRFPLNPIAMAVAAPSLAIGLSLATVNATAEETALEEVVVTSTKREASLQDGPN